MSEFLVFLKKVLGIAVQVEAAMSPVVNLLGPVLAAFGGPAPAAAVAIFNMVQKATQDAEELLGSGSGPAKLSLVSTYGGALVTAAVNSGKLTKEQGTAVTNLLPVAVETVITTAKAVETVLTPPPLPPGPPGKGAAP